MIVVQDGGIGAGISIEVVWFLSCPDIVRVRLTRREVVGGGMLVWL